MKLSEHTKNTIKKVKTDKREINLEKKGSLIIYSYENIKHAHKSFNQQPRI